MLNWTYLAGGFGALGLGAGVWWLFLRRQSLEQLATKDPHRFLRSLDLFRGLNDEDFAQLRPLLEQQKISKGQYLFRENDKGSSLFIVATGGLRVVKVIDNVPKILKVAKSGDILGEMALLSGQPRTAAALAEQDTTVYILDRNRFGELKGKSQLLIDSVWSTYSWNTLDNYLRSGKEWRQVPPKDQLQVWYARQMAASVEMGQDLPVPQGAGLLFAVTGRLTINGKEFTAPTLQSVNLNPKITATRSSRVIWFMSLPGLGK